MAITVSGVKADLDVTEWAEHMEAHALVSPSPDGVLAGFSVSVATGTRLLSVSSGSAVAPGVLVDSTAAEAVTLDSNASGNPRIDAIVLEVNWSGNASTAGDVKFVKGTAGASPSRPTLTQVPGSVWQIPLAWVTVANGAGQLTSGNVATAYPLADTGHVSVSVPGGYEQTGTALAVRRRNGMVEFSGAFRRSGGNVGSGTAVTLTTLPEGFRPKRDVGFSAPADLSGTPKVVGFYITTAGVVTMYPTATSLTTGDVIRPHATWLSEV